MSAEKLLSIYRPEIVAVVAALRKMISEAVPEITERVLPGCGAIGFRHRVAGHICAIFPADDAVKVYFEYGKSLRDPKKFLKGDTKQTRYLIFRGVKEIDRDVLAGFMRQAVKLKM